MIKVSPSLYKLTDLSAQIEKKQLQLKLNKKVHWLESKFVQVSSSQIKIKLITITDQARNLRAHLQAVHF